MRLAPTLLRKVAAVPGRPEKGRWIRTLPKQQADVPLEGSMAPSGLHPEGWFPVLYATEKPEDGAVEGLDLLRRLEPTWHAVILVVLDVELERVLDLCDPRTRLRLSLTLKELIRSDGISPIRDLEAAAYRSGFDGVIYPRPLRPRRRNLCIFVDRVATEVTGTYGPYSLGEEEEGS